MKDGHGCSNLPIGVQGVQGVSRLPQTFAAELPVTSLHRPSDLLLEATTTWHPRILTERDCPGLSGRSVNLEQGPISGSQACHVRLYAMSIAYSLKQRHFASLEMKLGSLCHDSDEDSPTWLWKPLSTVQVP
jgi:hypothetical protein